MRLFAAVALFGITGALPTDVRYESRGLGEVAIAEVAHPALGEEGTPQGLALRSLEGPMRVPDTTHRSAVAGSRPAYAYGWAQALSPLDVRSEISRASARIRLYRDDGSIDADEAAAFERIAAGLSDAPHALAERLEQLVVKAAYHFHQARISIVSAWRENAGRHGTGEAIDFKLAGVRASVLAGYLRALPRAGVGIYTHPRTQFVHLDVRTPSYHWLDASPPGVHWHEARLRDPLASRRDASWTPAMDLPLP